MRLSRGRSACLILAMLGLMPAQGQAASAARKKPAHASSPKQARKIAPPTRKATVRRTGQKARRRYKAVVPVSAAVRAGAEEFVSATLVRTSEGIPIENSRALVPFFERLYRSRRSDSPEPLRILHYGDSHTASDDWANSVRELLQARFGDGGNGFSYAGRPFLGYRRWDLRSGASRNWKPEGLLARTGDGLWGLGGVSISTSRPGEYVTLESQCRRLEIFYLQQPGGGDLELIDNGTITATIHTAGTVGPGYFDQDVPPGSHQFELRTLNSAPVRLYGWVTEKDRGVTYETLGINGAQASIIFRWDSDLLADQVARRDPALIVLAYGTNEAGDPDWTLDSYRDMFTALISKFRDAAPAASILVLGPPDREWRVRGRWVPYDRVERIIVAQREAATANGCAFWDLREKMGGAGAMRQWVLAGLAQRDHIHFTSAGYRRIGSVLFQDLMYNYEGYLKVREELLGQTMPAIFSSPGADGNPGENH